MTRHKVNRNDFRLENGAAVNIEYWTDARAVQLSRSTRIKHQVSTAEYHASIDAGDELNPQLQAALIDSLANALEYALIGNRNCIFENAKEIRPACGPNHFGPNRVIERVLAVRGDSRNFPNRKFFFDVVAIIAPGCTGAAEAAPDILADAAVLERAAGVELNLQDAGARIVADGAQLAGIDFFISMLGSILGIPLILVRAGGAMCAAAIQVRRTLGERCTACQC